MQKIYNVTIKNNVIEGQKSGPLRLRMHHVDVHSGDKHPSSIVFDVTPGEEKNVNLTADSIGFEVRPAIDGGLFSSDTEVTPDLFGKIDAYENLKKAIKAIPLIRGDMTLSDTDRDAKAGTAWAEVMRLAQQ